MYLRLGACISFVKRSFLVKAIILAGGKGTRLSEETEVKPKPMVEIGGSPIIWHIMKIYTSYGITDFIICCGYKSYVIKEYFANYLLHSSDVTLDLKKNTMNFHHKRAEPWTITLVDTGDSSMTGGRLLRVKEFLKNEKHFCFTYGDGLVDLDIKKLIEFHKSHGKVATLTAATPEGRYGHMSIDNNRVKEFREKNQKDNSLVNGGFFVFTKDIFDHIEDDHTILEKYTLPRLASIGELMAYRHNGFWQH